jgi:hypothetical protein
LRNQREKRRRSRLNSKLDKKDKRREKKYLEREKILKDEKDLSNQWTIRLQEPKGGEGVD